MLSIAHIAEGEGFEPSNRRLVNRAVRHKPLTFLRPIDFLLCGGGEI